MNDYAIERYASRGTQQRASDVSATVDSHSPSSSRLFGDPDRRVEIDDRRNYGETR
jgi:hypothetical protein